MPPENPIKTQKLKVGASPLMEAALKCGVKKCKNLVDNGADLNEKTKEHAVSVMHFAAANKKHGVELVKYFASLGCKLDAKDSGREEPIDYAIREEAFAVAKEILTLLYPCSNLLQFCVMQRNLVVAKRVHDLYPELANELTSEGSSNTFGLKLLLEKDKDLFNELYLGQTIAQVAASSADLEVFKWLIEEAKVDKTTPILLAIKAGNVCAVEKLCQLGANLSVTYNGVNLVHQCIYLDNLDVAKLLCSFSDTLVSVKSPIGGKTALHVAAELGNDRFCEWLVEEEGVDVKEKTAKGETAADLVPWFNLHLLKYLKIVALK
ncbi:Hypothetical predicted protein [Cloeon dipterum]|uniref:Uncharacterized protein n=1 Tax=Cloeon dipterum TaxID=197152 RepID=A0A8S1E073_9INSE|nr:Hypothetical predicted protein [Cloeon dipterum]